jgi:hypothetical protein
VLTQLRKTSKPFMPGQHQVEDDQIRGRASAAASAWLPSPTTSTV